MTLDLAVGLALLACGLVWWLLAWSRANVERAVREARRDAAWDAIYQRWLAQRDERYAMLTQRLLDCSDPDITTEGLGMVQRSPQEHIVTFSSFSPADQAVLDEASRAVPESQSLRQE